MSRLQEFYKETVVPQLMKDLGIDNVMALRGDAMKDEAVFQPQVEGNQYASELVKQISDVVTASLDKVERPPANIGDIQGNFFNGVFKTSEHLIGILDVQQVMDVDD